MGHRRKGYRHVEVTLTQVPKHTGTVCGDLWGAERTLEATTLTLCDGMGSGVKANVAATLCESRLRGLLRSGFSARESCERLARAMSAARTEEVPFSAFTLAHIVGTGAATVMSFEMPPPLLISHRAAHAAELRLMSAGKSEWGETHAVLDQGQSVLLISDGVSQSGLGRTCPGGWGVRGVADFINAQLNDGLSLTDLPKQVLNEVRRLNGGENGDDVSIALVTARPGRTVHVFTGPPTRPSSDESAIRDFLSAEGQKIVCGSVTADLVAARMGSRVEKGTAPTSPFDPPRYTINGIDLVTEGAVTLNQVFNSLGEPTDDEDNSGVSALRGLLQSADRIFFWMGLAENAKQKKIFRQIGVLPRAIVVPLLAEKLQKVGKLVVVYKF